MRRLAQIFREPGTKLIPFVTAGYPRLEDTVALVLAAEKAGADVVELGMPFSDPLADGPVIQAASQQALDNGVTLSWILDQVRLIRQRSTIPIVLMGYANPIYKMGAGEFIEQAARAGVDGLILPDLPPEEDPELFAVARKLGISTIFLIAPNTPAGRIAELGRQAEDLLYAVAVLGITGSGASDSSELQEYLVRVRSATEVPFVVGFGVSTKEQAAHISKYADGIVIGSALLKEIESQAQPAVAAHKFISNIASYLAK